MYKATGRADLWARLGEKVDERWNVPGFIFQDEAYGVEYMYDRKMDDPMAETIMRVRIEHGVGLPYYFANLVRYVSGSKELSGIAVIESMLQKHRVLHCSVSQCCKNSVFYVVLLANVTKT